jgi:hypothetical protein
VFCRCYPIDAFPDGDLYDFFQPDDAERFICARCHRALHWATLVRLRRHQEALERTANDPEPALRGRDYCRACKRSHRWVGI